MPIYDYICVECGEIQTRNTTIADRLEPEKEQCPICSGELKFALLGAPSIGDGVRLGVRRPDGGMKEVLQKIHSRTPGSRLNDVSNLTRM